MGSSASKDYIENVVLAGSTNDRNFFTCPDKRKTALLAPQKGLNCRETVQNVKGAPDPNSLDILTAVVFWIHDSDYLNQTPEKKKEAEKFLGDFIKAQSIDVVAPLDESIGADRLLRYPKIDQEGTFYRTIFEVIVNGVPELFQLLDAILESLPEEKLSKSTYLGEMLSQSVSASSFLKISDFNKDSDFDAVLAKKFEPYRKAYLVLAHHAPLKTASSNAVAQFCSSQIYHAWTAKTNFDSWQKKMQCTIELFRDLLSTGRVEEKLIFTREPDSVSSARVENCLEKAVREGSPDIVKELISHVLTSSHVDIEAELKDAPNKKNLLQLAFCTETIIDRRNRLYFNQQLFKQDSDMAEYLDTCLCEIVGAILTLPGAATWKVEFEKEKTARDLDESQVKRMPKSFALLEANGLLKKPRQNSPRENNRIDNQ